MEYDHDSSGLFLWGHVSQDNAFVASGSGACGRQADEDKSLGERLSDRLLYDAGVFITPGFIFGKNGRDYIRISLCAKPEVLAEAERLIGEIL